MKKKGKLITFLKALLFSAVFAILFKWWQTGTPFHSTTIIFGIVMLLQILVSLYIAKKFFAHLLNMPIADLRKRMAPYFILFLFFVLLVCLFIIGISVYAADLLMGNSTQYFLQHLFEVEYPPAIKYYAVFALMISVVFFYKVWRQAADREQQLREENLRYRYRTLKAQVNPHFLFNSLNTLSEMVYTDPRRADAYIQKLSGIYRYILDNEETDLVPLKKEIEFIQRYFELQRERDDNKIELYTDVPEAEKFSIIPISLQILVENALKHNVASEKNPLKVRIVREEVFVVVSNTIQRKTTLPHSPGTGLANLKERAKLITGREIIVEQEKDTFIVKLPIVTT